MRRIGTFVYAASALLCLQPLAAAFSLPSRQGGWPPSLLPRQDNPAGAAPVSTVCGEIFDDIAANGTWLFAAAHVYDCLTSVPFHSAVALRFIEYYNTTLQFHSTLAYLRDPPPGYQQPAVDVLGEFEVIKTRVLQGFYQNQYAFQADVYRLAQSMHDGHVDLVAGILHPFSFSAPLEISSVSRDGKEAPQIYVTYQIIQAQNSSWELPVSPIVEINGRPAIEFLTAFAAENAQGALEPHADWNRLMWHPAVDILDGETDFTYGLTLYPGDEFNVVFANGTRWDGHWLAVYNYAYDTGPLTTGGDLFNYFVLGLPPASLVASDDALSFVPPYQGARDWFDETSGAYPRKPDVVQEALGVTDDGDVTGYFFRDISTGILSLPTFEQHSEAAVNFSRAVGQFIDGAAAAGLQNIIIDLQQNDGGMVSLAYDTFAHFFPDTEPFGGSRRRSHRLADVVGGALTEWWGGLDRRPDSDDYFDFLQYYDDEWVIPPRLSAATNAPFPSWAQYSGPRPLHGDRFSLTERYNLSDPVFTDTAFNMPIYSATTKPVWDPSHIVLLTDALCSSTCALFVEFMTRLGVRTVVAGGRPEPGPMQAVGGSRGARQYSAYRLDTAFAKAANVSAAARPALPEIPPGDTYRDTGMWTPFAGINLRDQVRDGDSEGVPLQFRYEPADCRIYYTLRNIYNATQLWRDVAAAAWVDSSLCVAGSTAGLKSATPPPRPRPPAPRPADNRPAPPASGSAGDTLTAGPSTYVRAVRVTDCSRPSSCQDMACRRGVELGCGSGRKVMRDMCVPIVRDVSDCEMQVGHEQLRFKAMFLGTVDSKGRASNYQGGRMDGRGLDGGRNMWVCVPTRGAGAGMCSASG
ncbi:hypothetical protein B0T18DRAFT_186378 [Schizothecium vesticola]|uniref:Tail specific protease domain-containing protein n=1 Tax=Schizothecium vesticola TaxID=314040 RepID=A0AA40K2S3_9PEZI|nr:hypothetical protein B0T18DRAFT_186378 [Schizothecium vesticola]